LTLSGCKTAPKRHIAVSPGVSVSQTGQVELSGDAQAPAKVATKKTDSKIGLPEGSKLEFNEKLGVFSITLSKASEIALNRSETDIQGAVSYTPDKGPTVGEEAEARATFWTTLGLRAGSVLGAAIAIFGLVRGWNFVMYGGAAVSLACLFGIFQQRHPVLMLVIGLGIATAIAGPVIYHTRIKKLEPQPPDDGTNNR
jgi:hypothetical protein